MSDDKYIVFKRSEWEEIVSDKGTATRNEFLKKEITDATVIRGQDIFSGPALHEYAGQISTTLEIMDVLGVIPTHPAIEHLRELRQYFQEQASNADASLIKKIPD